MANILLRLVVCYAAGPGTAYKHPNIKRASFQVKISFQKYAASLCGQKETEKANNRKSRVILNIYNLPQFI